LEDQANLNLLNGFVNYWGISDSAVLITPTCNGGKKVWKKFEREYISSMNEYPERLILMLLDFDESVDNFNRTPIKFQKAQETIPPSLKDRVFILGSWKEPEDLKRSLQKKYEEIGSDIAKECVDGKGSSNSSIWNNEFLRYNIPEIQRMKQKLDFLLSRDPPRRDLPQNRTQSTQPHHTDRQC
jgi:hypothetical protein